MRNAYFVLGALVGLAACSHTPSAPGPHAGAAAPAATETYRHYTQAAVLQYSIMNRPPLTLLDESGEELVLTLARAQNCLASRSGNLELAEQTQTLLETYVEFHRENGSEPTKTFHRRARRAHIDAEVTQQGTASSYFLGCSMRQPFTGTTWGSDAAPGRTRGDYYGTGMPWNQRPRSVPGGVIR